MKYFRVTFCFLVLCFLIPLSEKIFAQKQSSPPPKEKTLEKEFGGKILEEIVVEEETIKQNDYAEEISDTALKTPLPLLNTPQNISVINRKLLNDIDAKLVADALDYSSGVKSGTGGYRYGIDFLAIRGFKAGFNSYQDGLHNDSSSPNAEIYGLERIQILKGPASTLYGATPIGGMLHFESKKPHPENFAKIRLATDSFGLFEQGADFGMVNKNKSLYFRLVALSRNQKSFIELVQGRRQYIAPSLTWDITNTTKLTLLFLYQKDKSRRGVGLPAVGTIVESAIKKEVPINLYLGGKDINNFRDEIAQAGYQFKHRFTDWFSVRQNFRYSNNFSEITDVYWLMRGYQGGKFVGLNSGGLGNSRSRKHIFNADTATNFTFSTFGAKNFLSIGFDFEYFDSQKRMKSGEPTFIPDISKHNPKTFKFKKATRKPWSKPTFVKKAILGGYLQENLKMGSVILSLGGRYHFTQTKVKAPEVVEESPDTKLINYNPKKKPKIFAGSFSPKIGISYEFIKGYCLYSNYSESFKDQSEKEGLKDGKPFIFKPEKGLNFEAGFKLSILDGKLTSNLAFYLLNKTNIAVPVVTGEPYTLYELIGKQQSRGVEFDTSFSPLPGLVSTLAYTFTDSNMIKAIALKKDKKIPGVPEHMLSTWVKYTIQSTFLKNLGFGLGARYFTKQYTDFNNDIEIPPYYVLDTALYYAFQKTKAQINFYNITNNRYFTAGSTHPLDVIFPGPPFNVRASLTATF